MDFFSIHSFQPQAIIEYGGIALLLLVVFIETGIFFGFFLPGDSLLFVAGILSDSPYIDLPIWLLAILVIIAAVAGTAVGYLSGYWAKGFLDRRRETFFYRKSYLELADRFYQRHGMKAFILGRFLPIIRTFVPILAGMVRVNFKTFLFYNILGAIIWATSLIFAGHWIGNAFPAVVENLELIIVGMILLSGLPIFLSWWKYRKVIVNE